MTFIMNCITLIGFIPWLIWADYGWPIIVSATIMAVAMVICGVYVLKSRRK